MQNLDMETLNSLDNNIEIISKLFPQVITEKEDENGNTIKAIDFELFKQLFSSELVEWNDERYKLDWPWKKASILKANTPIRKTLRPIKEDSVDFDNTWNLYIEWDNFEVLKILQESYLWQVKLIYIDSPYNTWNDFVYKDNFKISKDEYEQELWTIDEEWWKLFKNTDTNWRFHSDWLSMMYERLVVARDLLKDDWVIFMSIDDNEVHNLRKIADEVFWEENFIATLHWKKKKQPSFLSRVAWVIEYLLVYEKSNWWIKKLSIESINDSDKPIINSWNKESIIIFPAWIRVKANVNKIDKWIVKNKTIELEYLNDVNIKDGRTINEVSIKWPFRYNQTSIKEYFDKDLVFITTNLWLRRDVSEEESNKDKSITDLLLDWWQNQDSDKEQIDIFWDRYFDNPKPILFIYNIVKSIIDKWSIVLDFFSWSWTTAHAVMQLNSEDGWNRKFIMVQIPEETDESSKAYKAWYKNICEIWKERIRRAGKKIIEENKDNLSDRDTPLDTWFRVYRVDSSNMKDVYYHPTQITQDKLFDLESNIKEDRTGLDILTWVILDLWLTLDLPIEEKTIAWNKVYFVAGNSLVACFDENINFDIVDEIAKLEPLKVVFRDSSFRDDKDRINFETRFKKLSPESDLRVL